MNSIGINVGSERNSVGIAYIYLPSNEDRDNFIKNCIRTATVTIITENREVLHKVPIGKLALQFIEFPKNRETLGTPVSFITHPSKQYPIIVDVYHFYDEDTNLTGENQFNFIRKSRTGQIVEISGDAEKGMIRVNISGGESTSIKQRGKLKIDVINSDKTAEVDLNVMGTITINASSAMNIKLGDNLNLETLKTLSIFAEKTNFGEGKEPIPLGTSLVEELKKEVKRLDDVINALQQGVAVLNDGGAAIKTAMNAALVSIVNKANYDNSLSKILNTD